MDCEQVPPQVRALQSPAARTAERVPAGSLYAGINDRDALMFYYLAAAEGKFLGCRGASWLLVPLKFLFASGYDLLFDL